MTPQELYDEVLQRSQLESLHPLHESMMRSCCESALLVEGDVDDTTLVFAVQLSFVKMNEILKHALNGALANTDEVKFGYRGNEFNIPKGSPLASV